MIRANLLYGALIIALFVFAQWQGWSLVDDVLQWAMSYGLNWR